MTITTPSHDWAPDASVTGDIPTQRTVPTTRAALAVVVPAPAPAVRPAPTVTAVLVPTVAVTPARSVTVTPARSVTPAPAVTASPVRVARVRAPQPQPPRQRRWQAAVGGLAAGLTLGTVGAVGAAFAISATVAGPAPTATVVAASPASLSPNVSVPGRVLTAVDDGTWQVGVDIVPGTYMTTGAVRGATCRHVLRTARTGGDITARVGSGLDTVVLTGDDTWFATSGCATWNRIG